MEMAGQTSTSIVLLVLLVLPLSPSPVQGQEHVQVTPGDVMLTAMFSINSLEGDACGAFDVNVMKRVMAVTWFLDILNDMDYFGGGIKLGLTVYRTCQSQGRAMTHAVDILSQFRVLTPQAEHTANSTVPLLGLLGPDRTTETKVVSRFLSSLPSSRQPLELSASATGQTLADKALHSNLFRVIPPDGMQVEVLLKLLKALQWNYVTIIYDDHDYGRLAFDQLHQLALANDICVPYHAKVPLDSRKLEFSSAVDSIADVIWNNVIKGLVYIGSRSTVKEFLIKLETRALFPRFIFSDAVGLQESVFHHGGHVLALSKGAFVTTPPSRALPEFKDYWNAIWTNRTLFLRAAERNPWLAQYFQELSSGCSAEDNQCWSSSLNRRPLVNDYNHWLFEYYNVKAVAVFAALLKKMVTIYCQGHSVGGLCTNLKGVLMTERNVVQNLLQTSSFNLEEQFVNVTSAFRNFRYVQFDELGEIVEQPHGSNESRYDVYNFQQCQQEKFCFQKVASLTRDNDLLLNLAAVRGYDENGDELVAPNIPQAQCAENAICTECLPPDIANEIIMVPGDFYFVAVAPAYDRDRNDVLGCGNIRTSAGADMIQSVLFSLQQVNSNSGVFWGHRKLGVIILNSCYRELVIKQKLMDLYSGKLLLPHGRNSSAILPFIAGYVGAFYSSVSVAMYEVLSKVTPRFVLLSPTNTSPNLSDRRKYPLYLRLSTKSNDQAKAMLDIVHKLNSSYVQVIYDPTDDYSSGLKDAINQLSHSPPFNICVIHSVNTSYDDDSLNRVREKLLHYSWVSVVIVILQYEHVRNFTNIVTTALKPGQFVFIGSEAWERRQQLLDPVDGREKRLEGSFVLYHGLPVDRQFDDYFKKLDPFTAQNPWLRYFWEAAEDCYFQGSFEKKGKTPCPVGASGDIGPVTQNYVQNVWVPFYINAVKVFAQGLHTAMTEKCKELTLCEELTAEDLVNWLKRVRMDLTGSRQELPVFDANGDGGLGYDVYQIQRQAGKLTYVKVGSYFNGVGTLMISPPYPKSGHCLTQEQCHFCFPPQASQGTCPHVEDVSPEPVGIAFIVVLVLLGIIVVVCCTLVGVYFCRRRRSRAPHGRGAKSSLRRLQSLAPSEMFGVAESSAGVQRKVSTQPSNSSLCTGGNGEDQEAADIYDCIPHHHPNVHIRDGNAVVWGGTASPPSPAGSVADSRPVFVNSELNEDYISRGTSPGDILSTAEAPDTPPIFFVN